MLETLSYSFIQNAIIAAVLVSIITGIIGSLVVVNKMVFLSGGIAHSAYGGIGLAIFFGLPMLLCTSLFCVFVTIIIALASYKRREHLDILIGLTWALGMSLGIILVDLTPGYQSDLMSYLFGSLLAVTTNDILYMSILLASIIGIVFTFYREILSVSYDTEYATLRGVKTRLFYTIILVLSSLTIVVSIKVVGLILVIALLTIPIYVAGFFSKSLFSMMVSAALLSMFFSTIGLFLSYNFDLSSGPSIIIVSSVFALLAFLIKNLKEYIQ
ncbi:MAG: metal ABC transporter permease [Sulfurimonas sp.]|nr:metal ABC transporter permease [Sulfurimonas sp.]